MTLAAASPSTLSEMTGDLANYTTPKGSVVLETSGDGATATIKIIGRFDFSLHEAFRRAYETAMGSVRTFVIDFHGTDCIDSSALGMLLLMRENVGGERSDIRLVGGGPQIQDTLNISNFYQLFR